LASSCVIKICSVFGANLLLSIVPKSCLIFDINLASGFVNKLCSQFGTNLLLDCWQALLGIWRQFGVKFFRQGLLAIWHKFAVELLLASLVHNMAQICR
jgi:hypothetical protein